MSNNASFVGNIPEHYDQGLGPNIFVDMAAEMAERVAAEGPKRVLETAAGTGIVSRELRDRLAADARLTVTDLNAPMLEIARQKFRPGELVEFRPADAMDLPFDAQSFDAVVCQFGVMFYPKRGRSYREVRSVLVPGGRYFFSVWDGHKHNPFGRITHEVIEDFMSVDTPMFMTVPFSYRFEAIKDALVEAGFEKIEASVVRFNKVITDSERFARGLTYGNPLVDQIRARGVDPEKIVEKVLNGLRAEFGNDPGRMPLQALFISATKPR